MTNRAKLRNRHRPPSTWNPNDKDTGISLSSQNLIATRNAGGAHRAVRGTRYYSAGKFYIEFKIVTTAAGASATMQIGMIQSSRSLGSAIGGETIGFAIRVYQGLIIRNGSTALGNLSGTYTMVANDILSIAMDFTAGKFYCGLNGTWTVGNPSAGTGGISFTAGTVLYPAMSGFNLNDATAMVDGNNNNYAMPDGYSAW